MSEYMQGGALANDDLDFSAPRGRDHAAERSTAAVKSPALNVAIGVSAVAVLAGLALWFMQLTGGMVQTAMRPRPSASAASAASRRWPCSRPSPARWSPSVLW